MLSAEFGGVIGGALIGLVLGAVLNRLPLRTWFVVTGALVIAVVAAWATSGGGGSGTAAQVWGYGLISFVVVFGVTDRLTRHSRMSNEQAGHPAKPTED